jgi:hypothetical protein
MTGIRDQGADEAAPNTPAVQAEAEASGRDGSGADPARSSTDIAGIILELARERGAAKSICPSEAARLLAAQAGAEAWQEFMKPVRRAAIQLARSGQIEILRKGKPVVLPVPPDDVRGVIRLRIAVRHETKSEQE